MSESNQKQAWTYDAAKIQSDIYKTRKSRINAETRLLATERFIQGINIYYSCFAAITSIISLVSKNNNIPLLSVILTVVLAISIVYLNAQRYGERANDLKTNYIAMQGLLFEVSRITDDSDSKLLDIQKRYLDLLSNCENHRNIDYLTYLKYSKQLDKKDTFIYYMHLLLRDLVYLSAIVAPFILLILAVCIDLTGIIDKM